VTGKEIKYTEVDEETFKRSVPDNMPAQAILESYLWFRDGRYFGGGDAEEHLQWSLEVSQGAKLSVARPHAEVFGKALGQKTVDAQGEPREIGAMVIGRREMIVTVQKGTGRTSSRTSRRGHPVTG
jgi:hypothetical protein